MKKILVALLVLAMVASCMSFAFADTLDVYTMGPKSDSRKQVLIDGEVAADVKICLWVKPVLGATCTVEGCQEDYCEHGIPSLYVRTDGSGSKAAYYLDENGEVVVDSDGEPVKVYSGNPIETYALAKSADGWYYIECITTVAGSSYEISVNCQHSVVAETCQVAGVTIGGEPAVLTNTVGEKTTMETPVVEQPAETEDTVDVEETGVVSIAVVAVAAVIGGAVVLKKREF